MQEETSGWTGPNSGLRSSCVFAVCSTSTADEQGLQQGARQVH